MKAHISENETDFQQKIQSKLLEIRQAGLASGAKAISAVVLDYATDKEYTDSEKLQRIIDFCRTGLGLDKEIKNDN